MKPEDHAGAADGADEARACPLCGSERTAALTPAHDRRYRHCALCRLTFMEPVHRLAPSAEKARYDTHRNDPEDPGYRAFLAGLVDPLAAVLEPGAEGLDFGSGPGPTLSVMMRERGFRCKDFDPFYAPDGGALARAYDFVACTEVAEHFYRPGEEFERMSHLLVRGGWLGLMTQVLQPDQPFADWWYIRDPSHVCFYRPETMEWIASRFDFRMTRPSPNVVLFQKH